ETVSATSSASKRRSRSKVLGGQRRREDDVDVAAHRGRSQLNERSVVGRLLVAELELGAQVAAHRASVDPDVRPLADADAAVGLELTEAASAAEVRGGALELHLGPFRRPDLQANLDLAPEAESDPPSVFDVNDDLVAALPLARLDLSLLEQLAHLLVVAAGIELDLGRRATRHGLEVDPALRDSQVERDLARR